MRGDGREAHAADRSTSCRDADWPREALEELVTMPSGLTREQILNTVSWMARGAALRPHRCAGRVRPGDRGPDPRAHAHPRHGHHHLGLLSRQAGHAHQRAESGFLVPEFCRVLNYDELRDYMDRVPAPWLLKPRSEASALGIRKIEEPEQLWRALDELGDRQSRFLLEQFVPGDIFHVDSIVSEGKVVFSVVHQYGRPPMQVMHEGGVFTTRTVDRESSDWHELTALNASLAPSLGMVRGVTHAEYIRAHADGRFYFLRSPPASAAPSSPTWSRPSTGVNLWREWARLEVANLRGENYPTPAIVRELCGQRACRALAAEPDTVAFNDPEIVLRIKKHHDAGLIVRSDKPERVKKLLEEYSREFARRFLASPPPAEPPEE